MHAYRTKKTAHALVSRNGVGASALDDGGGGDDSDDDSDDDNDNGSSDGAGADILPITAGAEGKKGVAGEFAPDVTVM